MEEHNPVFSTYDTALATYLVVEGHFPVEIDYSEPRWKFMFLNGDGKLSDLATKYLTGKARVDPVAFSRVNKHLLNLLKNRRQWEVERG